MDWDWDWDWLSWSWEWVSWARIGGALALVGGIAAVVTFIASQRDKARDLAANTFVMVTKYLAAEGIERAPEPSFTTVQIHNRSGQPVYRVGIAAWEWGERRPTWRLRRHENWMTGGRIVGRVYSTIAPESETKETDLPGVNPWGPPGENPPVMLTFRDGRGHRWVRWPDGKLSSLFPSLYMVQDRLSRRKALERASRATSQG